MLDHLISRATLENLAGATSFQRGEAYFSTGSVRRLHATGDHITATVQGTHPYQAELRNEGGQLAGHCSCPRAADGYFCKHCVALGLAWLAENSAAPGQKRHDPWRDIEAFLCTQAPQTLTALLLEVAQRDDRLYQLLWLKAERAGAGANVAPLFRKAIDDATHIHDFIEWEDASDFVATIDQVVDSLAELLKPETASTLIELAEYAIERVEEAMEHVDESGGDIGASICRLGELHLQACLMARPDPAALAARLFELETTLPFGVYSFEALTYRDALGEEGLRRYRERAETEWRKLRPLDAQNRYDSRRVTLTRIMEQLAEASGNVDELVAIKSHDLSSAYRYLDIAETWTAAGQPDKALAWAERGLRAFAERPDNRLRDFLVAAYLERQRNGEALELTWVQFEERPSLEHYKKLNNVACTLGVWPEQRQRALAGTAEFIAREGAATRHWKPGQPRPDCSLRVEIALWEEDLGTAWESAHAGFCNPRLLLALAGKLESSRPNDAVSLYRGLVPPVVEKTQNAAYEEAVKLIRKIGGLMKAQHQSQAFEDYLAQLRMQFKPKRNFIKLLDAVTLRDL